MKTFVWVWCCVFSVLSFTAEALQTDCLFVLFSSGEATTTLPVLQARERQGKDFRVLVMGPAENMINPEMFPGKRLVLKDLGISQKIDNTNFEASQLSEESYKQLEEIDTKVLLVSSSTLIARQFLEHFSGCITGIILDTIGYDSASESFQKRVFKVQEVAQHVLCPAKNVADLFEKENACHLSEADHQYHVVGKPNLAQWSEELSKIDRVAVSSRLGLDPLKGRVVVFLGGHGQGYDRANPLFEDCADKLREAGYQVIVQTHPQVAKPKVPILEALSVADYIVGYNSSMVLDAALIGKNALYLIPESRPYHPYGIDSNLVAQVSNCKELEGYIKEGKRPGNLKEALQMPEDSVGAFNGLIDSWVAN